MRRILMAVLFASLLACLAVGAPAPRPKRDLPGPKFRASMLLGEWECRWVGVPCKAYFHEDGRWNCSDYHGTDWEGRWSLDEGALTIKETEVGGDGSVLEWQGPLGARKVGDFDRLTMRQGGRSEIRFDRVVGPRN